MFMAFHKTFRKTFFVFVLFAIWGTLIYSNTFSASFHYDDYENIVENKDVHWNDISRDTADKFVNIFFAEDASRPVSYISFALNHYFTGLDVSWFHYTNTAIHILTALGLFLFLKELFEIPSMDTELRERSFEVSLIASLLWLISPLQIQAVTYMVQRMASLAALFYIFSNYFYLKGRLSIDRNRYFFYLLSSLFALLAFGSKQNSFILPLFLFLLEVIIIRGGRIDFLFDRKVIICLFLFCLFFTLTFLNFYYTPVDGISSHQLFLIKTRLLTGVRVIVFYISQLLFPVPSKLSLEHDFILSTGLLHPPSTVFALIFFCALLFYVFKSYKKRPLLSFFLIWFFGTLAPETFFPYLIMVFEHRLYLPSMGFYAILAISLYKLSLILVDKNMIRGFRLTFLLILILFSVNTYNRNSAWIDEYTFWNDVIKKSPNLAVGYMQLGGAFFRDGDYHEALSNYLKAMAKDPEDVSVRYGLGVIYYNLAKFRKAVEEFSYVGLRGYKRIGNETSINYYLYKIAQYYYTDGRMEAAVDAIDRAIFFDPFDARLQKARELMLLEYKGKARR